MARAPYNPNLVAQEGPATFEPQTSDPWEGWFLAAERALHADQPIPSAEKVVPKRPPSPERLLQRWLVLAERLPSASVETFGRLLTVAGPWQPSGAAWLPDAVLIQPVPSKVRLMAAWLLHAPETHRLSQRWPRAVCLSPSEGLEQEGWANDLLRRLGTSVRACTPLLIQRPPGDPLLSPRHVQAALKAHDPGRLALDQVVIWVEAVAALEHRLNAWGVPDDNRWRMQRWHLARALEAFLPHAAEGLSPVLKAAWDRNLEDFPVWRHEKAFYTLPAKVAAPSPLSKEASEGRGWFGAVETRVHTGIALVPHLFASHSESAHKHINDWFKDLEKAYVARKGKESFFPNHLSAWARWEKGIAVLPGKEHLATTDTERKKARQELATLKASFRAHIDQWSLHLVLGPSTGEPVKKRARM